MPLKHLRRVGLRVLGGAALLLAPCAATAQHPGATTGAAPSAKVLADLSGQLRAQIARCWTIDPTAVTVGATSVVIEFELRPNGALAKNPRIVARAGQSTPVLLAQSATDAVRKCAPYTGLPRDLYDSAWHHVRMTFDAKGML